MPGREGPAVILLVNPAGVHQGGYNHPPLGLLYLAGACRSSGVECRIVDGYLEGERGVREAIIQVGPGWVGVGAMTPGRHQALDVVRLAKRFGYRTVMGGVHPTLMWHQVMGNCAELDYIVLGEGEESLVRLVQGDSPESIPGVVYRDSCGIPTCSDGPRRNVVDLDSIPFPAWDTVQFDQYVSAGGGGPRVVFTRGCWGNCSFCSTTRFWKGVRQRTPANMAEELRWLKRLGQRSFVFADDQFAANRESVLGLCEAIADDGMEWFATMRADRVDVEMLAAMKRAGCYGCSYGFESGCQRILDGIGKHITVEQNEQAAQLTKEAGLRLVALMIRGNVGETLESVADTRRFLERTRPDEVGSVGALWVLPGTRLYDRMVEAARLSDDFWLTGEPYYIYAGELDGPNWYGGAIW